MSRYLSALVPLLVACSARAQDGMGGPPSETVSMIWVVLFIVLFVGSIVGFFAYMWWNDRKKKGDEE